MDDALLVFARYPSPGQVKTRLIPRLGPHGASFLYRLLAEHAATVCSGAARPGLSLQVHVDPPERAPDVGRWWGAAFEPFPQSGADLGERMASAFRAAFENGARRAVCVGTDCVEITPELLSEAFDRLAYSDVALGPAIDGGYYLIGMSRFLPELFKGVDWGTARVFQQTRERIEAAGVTCRLLPMLSDIDTWDDIAYPVPP